MIRLATAGDVPRLVEMGLHFLDSSHYGRQFARNAAQLRATTEGMLASPDSDIFVLEQDGVLVGMIVVCVYVHPLSGERVAGELCWWVEPDHRRQKAGINLLRRAEIWARAHDADVFQMMAPTEDVGRFYEAVGYEKLETHYQRRLRPVAAAPRASTPDAA